MQTGALISDPKRFKFEGQEHYLKTAQEMRYLFRELPEACDNTLWIAERCQLEITFGNALLPNFPIPQGSPTTRPTSTTSPGKGRKQRWGDVLPDTCATASPTSSRSSTTWASRRTS